jgi:kynurenine formamidase
MPISIGIDFASPVRAFGVAKPTAKPLQVGNFIGSTQQGGSCNCDEVYFVPHCHGTHTETVAHVTGKPIAKKLSPAAHSLLYVAQLITVDGQQGAITQPMLEKANLMAHIQALVIRTLPNGVDKKSFTYDTQAAYICPEAMTWMINRGIEHLLIDTPSVDPIEDGGRLAAHRAFWAKNPTDSTLDQTCTRTITELIYVDRDIVDGLYALQINASNFALDAVPSNPTLFTMSPLKATP